MDKGAEQVDLFPALDLSHDYRDRELLWLPLFRRQRQYKQGRLELAWFYAPRLQRSIGPHMIVGVGLSQKNVEHACSRNLKKWRRCTNTWCIVSCPLYNIAVLSLLYVAHASASAIALLADYGRCCISAARHRAARYEQCDEMRDINVACNGQYGCAQITKTIQPFISPLAFRM